MLVNTWSETFSNALVVVWTNLLGFVPKLVFAVLVFALGWVLAGIFGRIVSQLVKALKFDKALEAAGIDDMVEKLGFKLNSAALIGGMVKWFVILVFFTLTLEMLHLYQVSDFMWKGVLTYLPQVIIAVLIIMVAAIVSDLVKNIVLGASKAAGVKNYKFLATFAKWAIWVFAILVASAQLGIATTFIQMFFAALMFGLSIAFGLAFGLGGKEEAARYLAKLRKEISSDDN